MDSKAIRTIVIFGVVGTVVLAFLMMFSLDQMTDTQAPQIAADISKEFERAFAGDPPTPAKLTMTREGKGAGARRVYTLHISPSPAVVAEERAISRLMYNCAEMCAVELGVVRGEVVIRCVAELPGGGQREAVFMMEAQARDSGVNAIRAVAAMPPAPADDATAAPVR